jgi:hypothetical protein
MPGTQWGSPLDAKKDLERELQSNGLDLEVEI